MVFVLGSPNTDCHSTHDSRSRTTHVSVTIDLMYIRGSISELIIQHFEIVLKHLEIVNDFEKSFMEAILHQFRSLGVCSVRYLDLRVPAAVLFDDNDGLLAGIGEQR